MHKFSCKTIFSALIVLLLLLGGCNRIQEPAPQLTREAPPNAATAPTSPPAFVAETPAMEAPAADANPTQAAAATSEVEVTATSPASCAPTPPDALGPFYTPGAPIRDKVGEGYVLSGVVRSTQGCAPISGAQIEIWMAGPDGNYTDDYRATLFSDENGSYHFESHFPPPYSGRPPHHHFRISAEGYQTLVTQHYPAQGQTEAYLDFVLILNQ